MSFSRILARGFHAANGTPLAVVLYMLTLGIQQTISVVTQGLTPVHQPEPGQPPPPEMFLTIGLGCFSCVWLIVMVVGLPWITGGTVGQLRDKIVEPGRDAGRFADFGSRFYVRMLLLFLLFMGLVVLCFLPLWIGGMVWAFAQMRDGPLPPERVQEMSQDVRLMILGIPFGLVVGAIGVVFNLAYAAVVVDNESTSGSLSKALGFCRARLADAAKLYLVSLGIGIPVAVLYLLPRLLDIRDLSLLSAVGIGVGVFISYLTVLNLGFAVSLYVARQPDEVRRADPEFESPLEPEL